MSYKFFHNTDCEFSPCHAGIKSEEINCLFCYCPLYQLEDCPGEHTYTAGGIKDCSSCDWVHREENYYEVIRILLNQ